MWSAIQCAVQGRGHLKNNIPCQDKTYSISSENFIAVSLADGAGSCSLSHIGASLVTRTICELLQRNFELYFSNNDGVAVKKDILRIIIDELNKSAIVNDCEIKDLSSTLLFVAVRNNCFILGHIGDGVIGYLKNNMLKVASSPNNGEFVNTTIFTTSNSALASMKLIRGNVEGIDSFILMSDGSESVFYKKSNSTLSDGLKKIIIMSEILPKDEIEKRLTQLFNNKVRLHTSDDCSLVCLSNVSSFSGFISLPISFKRELLRLSPATTKRIIKIYLNILDFLYYHNEQSLKIISKQVHVKPRYLEKKLEKLCRIGFVKCHNNMYRLNIINYFNPCEKG